MVSVESQPFSSCAIASADITADCACCGGYLPISRSMRFRASSLSMLKRCASLRAIARRSRSKLRVRTRSYFVHPVVDASVRMRHVPQTAAEGADLVGIGIFADFRRHHGADRKISKLGVRVIDDLVRRFRAADRTADDVASANAACLGAVSEGARAFHDEEHLLFAAVAVERAGSLAGRNDIVRITEV